VTSRDTYDIEEYQKELQLKIDDLKANIDNSNETVHLAYVYAILLNTTKWHALLQIEFDKSLAKQ